MSSIAPSSVTLPPSSTTSTAPSDGIASLVDSATPADGIATLIGTAAAGGPPPPQGEAADGASTIGGGAPGDQPQAAVAQGMSGCGQCSPAQAPQPPMKDVTQAPSEPPMKPPVDTTVPATPLPPMKPGGGELPPMKPAPPSKDTAPTKLPPTSTWRGGGIVTVRSGDTLSTIAARFGTTWQDLFRHNRGRIDDPNLIYPGQRLHVPRVLTGTPHEPSTNAGGSTPPPTVPFPPVGGPATDGTLPPAPPVPGGGGLPPTMPS